MPSLFPVLYPLLALLALGAPPLLAEDRGPTASLATDLSPSASVDVPLSAGLDNPEAPIFPRLSLGVGYPDIRVRAHIVGKLDGELKLAYDSQAQAYSGACTTACGAGAAWMSAAVARWVPSISRAWKL